MNPTNQNMKTFLIPLLLAIALLTCVVWGAQGPRMGVIQIDHEKVTATFAKGGPLLETGEFKIQAGRREVAGEVEMHARETDIFHILEGSATFVTGGELVEPRTVSPGETRAKEIRGGESHHLVKDDVIVIPTNTPHWFKEVHGPFLYYVVKVIKQ